MEIKSGKMVKNLEYFLLSYSKCFITEINVVLVKSYSISPIHFQYIMKKLCSCIFKVPIDHLFDNLESGKKEMQKLFGKKKSGKKLEYVVC